MDAGNGGRGDWKQAGGKPARLLLILGRRERVQVRAFVRVCRRLLRRACRAEENRARHATAARGLMKGSTRNEREENK
jgi:hypothetical protein